MKLLIIEDERMLSRSIAEYLGREDYLCEHAYTCNEALYRIAAYEYDCILLDLMLPDGNGLDILRNHQCPLKNHKSPLKLLRQKIQRMHQSAAGNHHRLQADETTPEVSDRRRLRSIMLHRL